MILNNFGQYVLNKICLLLGEIGILKWPRSLKKREELMKAKVTQKKGSSEYQFISIYTTIYIFATLTQVSLCFSSVGV
jgi:hypothetical protein